jgi:hypothetical protein
MPFNPNDELTMRFTVNEWNQVIAQLQEGPYKITAPLINKINLQAAQHERQAAGGDITARVVENGFDGGELPPDAPATSRAN